MKISQTYKEQSQLTQTDFPVNSLFIAKLQVIATV